MVYWVEVYAQERGWLVVGSLWGGSVMQDYLLKRAGRIVRNGR
jgi:hypothetical protein